MGKPFGRNQRNIRAQTVNRERFNFREPRLKIVKCLNRCVHARRPKQATDWLCVEVPFISPKTETVIDEYGLICKVWSLTKKYGLPGIAICEPLIEYECSGKRG